MLLKFSNFRKKKRLSFKYLFYSLLSFLFIIVGYAYFAFKGSLAQLDGKALVSTLTNPVTVQRDNLGIVELKAQSRQDLAVALGYVHAQERFFQMDLSRRNAAGELSELFGEKAFAYDKGKRIHEFRTRAKRTYKDLSQQHKELLALYTQGINQGLSDLDEAPFEYLLLRQSPKKWLPEDSLLVVYSMYLTLQSGDGYREHLQGILKQKMSPSVVDFLLPKGTQWDAPIEGDAFQMPAIPLEQSWSLISGQTQPKVEPETDLSLKSENKSANEPFEIAQQTTTENKFFLNSNEASNDGEQYQVGSNNWVVAGEISRHQSAILAGDMHLALRIPNIWFRAQMHYKNNNQMVDLYGLTLPGTPLLIAGSNTHIAWSFTNSYGDWSDLVMLTVNQDKTQYKTPSGYKDFTQSTQTIELGNGKSESFNFHKTIWGPVVYHDDKMYAYRWVAHGKNAVNLKLLEMENTKGVKQALIQANKSALPAQNFVVADDKGNIGWTIIGSIPTRTQYDSRYPQKWFNDEIKWNGYLAPENYPRMVNPSDNAIWTANARVLSNTQYDLIGDGGFALGARAIQIRNNLLQLKHASEHDLLKVQLDDRALFLTPWRQFILALLEKSSSAKMDNYKNYIANWSGRANKDDVGYWLVKTFRNNVAKEILNPLYQKAFADLSSKPQYYQFTSQYEGALWSIVKQQPGYLLPKGFSNWEVFFLAQIEKHLQEIKKNKKSLEESSWGSHNVAQIKHPLSNAVPFLSYFLDMPKQALSGDKNMPRVQGKSFGASQRMVVAPGHENEAILNMPGGQSGHPLSPFYSAGHNNWVQGVASPLMMQKPIHKLVLQPQ